VTTFPALIPSSRVFTPGEYPATAFSAFSGVQNRVRHSNVLIAAQLQLSFIGLPEADMLAIWQHYANRQGAFKSFALPAEIVSNGSITDYVPDVYLWRYAGPGVVEDLPCGGHNVTLTLETVPPSPASAGGVDLRVVLALAAGAGAAGEYVAGITESIALSFSGGAGVIGQNGITSTIALSLAAGVVQGDVSVAGINWNLGVLLDAGEALNLGRAGISETITLILLAGAADSGGPTDPNFANVSLLLHMDGSNGSTTFADSSSSGLTVTANGNAQISTAQSQFSGASATFDGSGDSLTIPYNSALDLIGGDFTIEFFARPSGADWILGAGGGTAAWNATSGLHWIVNRSSNSVQVQYYNGSSNTIITSSNTTLTSNVWSHVAVCLSGTTLYICTNGTVTSHSVTNVTRPTSNPSLGIGVIPGGSASTFVHYQGFLDELRITKGVARYTANFTPPTAPFPNA